VTRSTHSLVALVLAVGVAFALVVLAIGAAVTEAGLGTGSLSAESSTLLSTALGAAIGAVATYLGGRITSSSSTPPADVDAPTEPRWRPED
jgi:hypothetical protein